MNGNSWEHSIAILEIFTLSAFSSPVDKWQLPVLYGILQRGTRGLDKFYYAEHSVFHQNAVPSFSDKNYPHAPLMLAGMVDSLLTKTDFETEMVSESFPALVKAQIDDAVSIVSCKDDLSGFGNSRTLKYEGKYYYSENPLGGIETPIPFTGGTLQHISYAPIVLLQSSFPQMIVPARWILFESLQRLVNVFKESPGVFSSMRGSYPLAATIYCGLMKDFYSEPQNQ